MAAKSFAPLHDPAVADSWLELLSRELAGRLLASGGWGGAAANADVGDNGDWCVEGTPPCGGGEGPRRPRTLTLHFRGPRPRAGRGQQVTFPAIF
jgi:hypothetical protein